MDMKIACAALVTAALLAAATPVGAQYSGNSVLNNPASTSGGVAPTFRPQSPSAPPSGRFDTPSQRRLNIPGADSNPSMRGSPGAPCPPGAPSC